MSKAKRTSVVLGFELLCLLMISYATLPRVGANNSQARPTSDAQGLIIAYTSPQPDTGSNSKVWIMDADGTNQTQLTAPLNEDDRFPVISPDGSQIAYVKYDANPTLWMMNRDGSNSVLLPVDGNTQQLAWSPDGSRLAITNDAVYWWEIWLINPDGSHPQRITTNGPAAGSPSWSPDGQKIVYGVNPFAGYADLYTVKSDGTDQALLVSTSTTGFSNHMPAWSPDGTQIATIRWPAGSNGPYDLWLMNADGSGGTTLVQNIEPAHHNRVSWSADSSWLFFSKDGQIWRVQRDGTQLTQITTDGGWEPSIGPRSAACMPQAHESDIALVVDRSGSMAGEHKLDNAKIAITTFISVTQAPPDQLALVSFSSDARLDQPLTTDKTALISATQALTTASSTRIDLGLLQARAELTSTRHISTHARIIILLTDGQQWPPGNDPVVAQANAAKAEGAIIYTIGLGSDVDAALLQQIATGPDHYYFAPTSAGLEGIYQQISARIICPDIGGMVYLDQDRNEVYTPGIDAPLPDVAVQLDGPTISQTVSQVDGRYLFADNVSGTYTVSLVVSNVPTSYLPISPTLYVVNLVSTDDLDNNFGVREKNQRAIVFTRPQPDTNSNSEVWIMNVDGTNQTQLTAPLNEDRFPVISPDGSQIAYVRYAANQSSTLWVMNRDGSNPMQLPVNGNTQRLTWSPDGNRLAITNDAVDWWEIWLINPDGSNARRITTNGPAAGSPSWSPDGQKIVYGVNPFAGYADLYTVNSDGTDRALLVSASATGFSYHMPAWSPDGTQIAAIRWPAGSNGPYDLWLMNADGLGGTTLVQNIEPAHHNRVSWSADSGWLFFSKDGQIWRVQRAGTQLTQITTDGGWEPDTNASGFGIPQSLMYIYLPLVHHN